MKLTCKTCCHENSGETTKATNKRSARNTPVVGSDVCMCLIHTDVYEDADDNEDDDGSDLQK